MKIVFVSFFALVVFMFPCFSLPVNAELIVNGSFEAPTLPTGYQYVQGNQTTIEGWRTRLSGVERFDPMVYRLGTASDGILLLDLNTDIAGGGGIEQSIATEIGKEYVLTFNMGTLKWSGRNGTANVTVSAGASSQSFTVDNQNGTIEWTQFSLKFTAISATTTISFECYNSPGSTWTLIDKVSVDTTLTFNQDLIENGSFELPPLGNGYGYVPGDSIAIHGWTTSLTGVERFNPAIYGMGTSKDGLLLVDLNTDYDGGGGIEQIIQTEVGKVYTLSFYAGTSSARGRSGTGNITVSAGLTTLTYSVENSSSFIQWKPFYLSFTATSTDTLISFKSFDQPATTFAIIDKVSVKQGCVGM